MHYTGMKFTFRNSSQAVEPSQKVGFDEPDDTKELKHLSEPVLAEVARDAETMIASQYRSHLASEQRGFAILGIGLTTSTVLAGAYLTINRTEINGLLFANSAFWLAAGQSISATLAIWSVWPRQFHIPGNEPKNWLPEHWPSGVRRTLKQTRLEQSKILKNRIADNRGTAKLKARLQQASIAIGFFSVLLSGVFTLYGVNCIISAEYLFLR